MSTDINFEGNNYKVKSHVILGQLESPATIRSMIKYGIVKNEKQALFLIISMIVIFLSASFFIIYITFFKQPEIPPLPQDDPLMMSDQNF